MKSIWTMGEMIVEIMRPRPAMPHGQTDVYLGPFPSGAPAIMISAAARMGAPCGIFGGVGRDAHGDMLLARLEAQGVDCSGVLRSEKRPTGNAFVMYNEDGSREFIFHIAGTAATECAAPDISSVEDAGFFHLMGCSLTADGDFCRRIVETASRFREKGAKLSFDPNVRPELLGAGDFRAVTAPVLENCSVLLPGVDELLMLAGEREPGRAVRRIFENPVTELIVLKRGSKGCTLFTREGSEDIAACCIDEEKDATGAGDCFDGVLLASLLAGDSPSHAARKANAAGALNAAAFGPMEGDISPETVAEMLQKQYGI